MLRFATVHLDIDTREVLVAGQVQHLEPQAFDLLAYLVAHRDRVVPKSELLEQVWGDQFVSESALTTRIKEIRRATGDDGRRQHVIKNVRGRGYRFVAEQTTPTNDTADVGGRAQRRIPSPPATPSIGVEADVDRLAELTAARRLVTIVGPGGVGKTRLATEVARAVADRHALGARIVELSRISEPEAIGPSIRRSLDQSEASIDPADGFGAVDALLVMDNCEHLIDAVADHIPALLAGGERLRVLATSREPLSVPGEQRWPLEPLSTTGADSPAMRLLVGRARDVGVEVDPADPRAQAVVAHLDGIPLALEMGAARLGTMGLADLANEVENSVAALEAGPRGVPERHSTLRHVLAWSEALLTDDRRSALAEFSVFAGPVEATDLPGAVAAPGPVGTVRALVERSLVTVDTDRGARARYGSLGTVRQFGRDRLQEEGRLEAVRRRHATWFTEAAEAAAVAYDTAGQADAVVRVDAIFDELRAAHRWARMHDPSLAVRLSLALYQPAFQQLRLEVFNWSLALAEIVDADEDGVSRLHGELAVGLTLVGRIEEAREWAGRAIESASEPDDARAAFGALADIHLYTGELDQSLVYATRQVELLGREATWIDAAVAHTSVALALAYLGRREEALEAIPPELPEGAPPGARAWLAYGRGEVLLDSDPQTALEELDRAIGLAESVEADFLGGVAHVSAASLRTRTGHPEDAIGPLTRTIERLADRGNTTHLLTTLRNLPTVLIRLEQWHSAAQVLGGLSTATISPTYGDEAGHLADAEEAVRSALGDDAFSSAYSQGAGQSLDQTARFAIRTLSRLKPPPNS
jgi:predicted ATPase/DNA-binding winged helix-turn-helix (wHTH) protein